MTTPDRQKKRSKSKGEHDTPAERDFSHQILEAALHTAVGAILIIDDHGIIQSANPAATKVFGF